MKKYLKYILLFILYFFAITFIFVSFRMDTYNNYAFSYGIVNGSIPYKDFNLVVPLFGPFIYSIFLIFNKSIIMMYLEQALFLTLMSFLIINLLGKKSSTIISLLFLPIFIPCCYVLFPGYNYLLFFLLVLLLYLEDKKVDDRVIGIVLGFALLTKHNIGMFIFIFGCLYYIKDFKRFINRFIFGLIPIILFIIYLGFNHILYDFYNYCFLGLSEFKSNFSFELYIFILFIFMVCLLLYLIIKKKKFNISFIYLGIYSLVLYPLLDSMHFSFFFIFYMIVLLYNFDFKYLKVLSKFIILFIFVCIILWFLLSIPFYKKMKFYHYHNFPFELMLKSEQGDFNKLVKYTNNFDNVIYLGTPSDATMYYSSTNRNVNKYLVLFRGNYGKNGKDYIFNSLKDERNVYIIIDDNIKCIDDSCQYLENIPKYVKDNYLLKKKIGRYLVYYK